MVRSSLIQRAIYDATQKTLAVTFTTGRTYLYFGVPQEIAEELQSAESMGQIFNWRIRDQYEYRELD